MSRFATEPDAETDDNLSALEPPFLCDTCSEEIEAAPPSAVHTHRGDYYFCSDACYNGFIASLEDGE